jgi:hypothetical protein
MDAKWLLGVAAVAVLAFLGMGSVMAFPFGLSLAAADDAVDWQNVRDAVENGNYTAWRSAIESQLTEDNFQRLVEAYGKHQKQQQTMEQFYEAMEAGDYNTASALLPEIPYMGGMHGHGNRWRFRMEWPWNEE